MGNIGASLGKVKAYALIIDKNGMPRIDKPCETPKEVWLTLTQEQKDFVNSKVSENLRNFN